MDHAWRCIALGFLGLLGFLCLRGLGLAGPWALTPRAGSGDDRAIAIEVASGAAGPQTADGVVLRGFVLLPPGRIRPGDESVRLETRGGAGVPFEWTATGLHDDGSVRAARLVAAVPRPLVRSGGALRLAAGRPAVPRARLRAIEDESGVRVDTGAMTAFFARAGPDLLPELRCAGREARDARPARIEALSGATRVTSAPVGDPVLRAVRLEPRGALACTCIVAGSLFEQDPMDAVSEQDAGDDAAFALPAGAFVLRATFLAGAPTIEWTLCVRLDRDLGIGEDLALVVPLAGMERARVRVTGGAGGGGSAAPAPLAVAALDGRSVIAARGTDRTPLDGAGRTGIVVLRDGGPDVSLVLGRMRPNAPRMVEAGVEGTLDAVLLAGPFLWEAGLSVRAEGVLAATRKGDLRDVEAWLGTEPVPALVAAEHAADALPFDPPLDAGLHGVPADPLPALLLRVARAVTREGGFRDHGDYRLHDGFANLEYDPARAVLMRALATRDAASWTLARDMLHHWVAYDRSDGEGGVPAGFPFRHGFDHRSLEHDAGHAWSGGIVLGALLFGEPEFTAAASSLVPALVEAVQDARSFDEEHRFGWLLLALDDLLLLGPHPDIERAIDRLLAELARRQDARGAFRVERGDHGALFSADPSSTGGITMEALFRIAARRDDASARDMLLRASAFLAGDARFEDGGYARRVHYGAELGSEIGRTGRLDPIDELMVAAGLGRAWLAGGGSGLRTSFDELVARTADVISTRRLTPNRAARALVALRSIADTQRRAAALGERP